VALAGDSQRANSNDGTSHNVVEQLPQMSLRRLKPKFASQRTRDMSDELLFRKLRERDDGAFRDRFICHQSALQRSALSLVANPSLAVEIVQKTWAHAIAEIDRFAGHLSFKST
jgi:hypothetical protein